MKKLLLVFILCVAVLATATFIFIHFTTNGNIESDVDGFVVDDCIVKSQVKICKIGTVKVQAGKIEKYE